MFRPLLLTILIAVILSAPTARAGNDDSCDIGVIPAATLLLPYFEVDFHTLAGKGRTTLFTVTNVSALPQIAHVTLWTDWAYAALNFNIYLTPYGIQSVDLYDVFIRGVIAPGGAGSGTTSNPLRNPNLNVTPGSPGNVYASCAEVPMNLSPAMLADLQLVFATGVHGMFIGSDCGTQRLGGMHENAIGYLTVDVVNTCSSSFPGPQYFTSEVLFDNVLIGDYVNIDGKAIGDSATGNPMVHIRAIPEGEPAGSNPGTNLPFTFYDRYTATTPQTLPRSIDRRQPLPSTFAARWVQDAGTSLSTNYQIWREGLTGPSSTSCSVRLNSAIPLFYLDGASRGGEIVRFDEHENSTATFCPFECFLAPPLSSPAASSTSTSSSLLPPLPSSGDVAGWMYLNLNAGPSDAYGSTSRASQNWVTVTMEAGGRYAVLLALRSSATAVQDRVRRRSGSSDLRAAFRSVRRVPRAARRASHPIREQTPSRFRRLKSLTWRKNTQGIGRVLPRACGGFGLSSAASVPG
jgi:hypothetical protein